MPHYQPDDLARLRLAAATVLDLQKLEGMSSNRIGAVERRVALLDPDLAEAITGHLHAAGEIAAQALTRTYEQIVSPAVKAWEQATKGTAPFMLGLLLAEIGDPFVAYPMDFEGIATAEPYERTLAELWAYCQLVPGRRYRPGMSQEQAKAVGNPTARRHLWLLADLQLKCSGPYRPLYDYERAKVAERLHGDRCAYCGTPGHPAEPGSPWMPRHQHGHALRIVGKRMLRDLWRVRRDEYRAEIVEVAA